MVIKMNDINRIGLVWISFFSYAFTGALVVVTGMIIGNIADYFHLSISRMSNTFTFLNAGILTAILLNSWLIEIVSLKKQLIFGFLLTFIAVIGIMFSHGIFYFSINIFVLGLVSGITMSIGTFIITHVYPEEKRGSRLLLTDSFFSMSGMIFPVIAAHILEKQIPWYWIYTCIGSIYLAIIFLTINLTFPRLKKNVIHKNIDKEKWNMNVFLLSISAMLYILGQLGFISWVPQYGSKIININLKQTGRLVSNFWMSYMIGMWVLSFIIKFFNLRLILIFLTGISTFLMYMFIHIKNYFLLQFTIVGLGFFSSAIYTIIITLASLQTNKPSPKLINFILLFGTIGTLLTFIITSPIVEKKGLYTVLLSSSILYGIVFVLSILINFLMKHQKNSKKL